MTIAIEKNVPPPVTKYRTLYPFRQMAVDDSFVVLLADSRCETLVGLQSTLTGAGRSALGSGAVRTRQLPDGTGFRVWRVA